MGRKSLRNEKRRQILIAFADVLADHGYAGATIIAVAEKAGLTPGLLHHHFKNKADMLNELLNYLIEDFSKRTSERTKNEGESLESYINSALKLDEFANTNVAKCWVGVLAEGLRDPALFSKIKTHLDSEIIKISSLSKVHLSPEDSSSILAYILGALVFGAYAPKSVAGFGASGAHKLLSGILKR